MNLVELLNLNFANLTISNVPTWTIQNKYNNCQCWHQLIPCPCVDPSLFLAPSPPTQELFFILDFLKDEVHPSFHLLMQSKNLT
jgi:hypothetical protein